MRKEYISAWANWVLTPPLRMCAELVTYMHLPQPEIQIQKDILSSNLNLSFYEVEGLS